MTIKQFTISLPTDLVNPDRKTDQEIIEELAGYAIDQAREEADDWVVPARWEAVLTHGDIRESQEVQFTVKRFSN
jgi:hypothetical protein